MIKITACISVFTCSIIAISILAHAITYKAEEPFNVFIVLTKLGLCLVSLSLIFAAIVIGETIWNEG